MVPNQKEVDAIREMTEIGIPDETVRTKLKELLKMYADDWSHIERENYRALADYIFECEEHKEPDTTKVKESYFRAPLKKLQLIHDVEASPSENEVKPLSGKRAQNEVFTPQVHLKDKRKEPATKKSCLRIEKSEHPHPEDKGKKHISRQFASGRQISNSKRSSVICLSNQKSNVHLDPKNKHLTSGRAQLEVPQVIQPIDSAPVRNEETWLGHKVLSKSKKKNEGDGASEHQRRSATTLENASIRESSSSDFEIASSELGEVKVSLHCNEALERPDFCKPNLDAGKGLVNAVPPPVLLKDSSVHLEANDAHDLTILESSVKSSLNSRTQIPRLLSRDGLGFLCNIVQPTGKVLVKIKGGNSDKDILTRPPHNLKFHWQVKSLVNDTLLPFTTYHETNCFGDCVSSSIPCALEGLVKEKFLDECILLYQNPQKHTHIYCKDCPNERSKNEDLPGKCKGHLMRKFIKECWSKCGCDIQCVSQFIKKCLCTIIFRASEFRSGLPNLLSFFIFQVFLTGEGKGWGIRSLEKLPRDADWGSEVGLKDEEALCLDATIAFFTSREVEALEELTWDYGIDFQDHDHPIEAFQCLCGSKGCRDKQYKTIRTKSTRYNLRS
ncbi:hypothetical protein MKX01_039305 [Papaver californicum]|nr:hypothetical protein MKX01_039305 [Papaver californicum]